MKFAAFYSIYLTQKINKNHKISSSIDFSKHHTKPPWSLKWLEGNYFRVRGKKYAIKSRFVNHESVSKVFEDYQNSDLYFWYSSIDWPEWFRCEPFISKLESKLYFLVDIEK